VLGVRYKHSVSVNVNEKDEFCFILHVAEKDRVEDLHQNHLADLHH